MLCRIVNESAV